MAADDKQNGNAKGFSGLSTLVSGVNEGNSAETMRVAQYHVPLGAAKALIMLSYIEGVQQAFAAHNRLKNSIVIR